jgi:hypothetical protein
MHLAIITKFQVRGSSAAMAALGTLLATTMMHVIATRAPGIAAWPGSRCRLVPDAEPRAPHPGAVRGPKPPRPESDSRVPSAEGIKCTVTETVTAHSIADDEKTGSAPIAAGYSAASGALSAQWYLTELMEGCFRVNPEAANRDVSSGD